MAKQTVFFNKSSVHSLIAAAVYANMYPATSDNVLKDLDAITTGNITTYLGTLTDDTYDAIYLGCENGVVAATGKLSKTQCGLLYAKLKTANRGTVLDTVDNADTVSTVTIGKTGEGWTTNQWAGKWVYIYGGTGIGQLAKIVSNTATVLTVGSAFDTTPDATSDFKIIDTDMKLYEAGNTASGLTAGARMWDTLYPGVTQPLAVYRVCNDKFAVLKANADSVGNNSLTDTGAFTGLSLAGYYVYIYSSTLGKHQVRQILSHTDNALTLTANWTVNPTGTITYRIVRDLQNAFMDKYTENYINTYLKDITNSAQLEKWMRILDPFQKADEMVSGQSVPQDAEYLISEVKTKGKIIEEYIATT